jgi:hypothetical protein
MPSLADYFDKITYKPKWFIGDRVSGKWNGIPFVGSVLNDTEVNPEVGPVVHISVDLPISYKGKVYTLITTKPDKLNKR